MDGTSDSSTGGSGMNLEISVTYKREAFCLQAQIHCDQAATGIFGPSGAGKSTLLHLISGLVRPSSGRVVLDGTVLDDVAAGVHIPTHRRRLGVVFQHGHLFPHRKVSENLRYGEKLVPSVERKISFAKVVELLELGSFLDRLPKELSGGERQRVALGRALLCSPRLLLFDEPLAALDRGLKRQILPFLRRIRETCAIPLLHVSHDLSEILTLTEDLVVMDHGRIVAHGPIVQIAQLPGVLPLLHDLGLVNVLHGTISGHSVEDGLSKITLPGGQEIVAPLVASPLQSSLDVLLRPEDIVLATAKISQISLQNQIPGRITAITSTKDRVLVTVDIGASLLVEVSPRAVRDMNLVVGQGIWCFFKALAVQGRC